MADRLPKLDVFWHSSGYRTQSRSETAPAQAASTIPRLGKKDVEAFCASEGVLPVSFVTLERDGGHAVQQQAFVREIFLRCGHHEDGGRRFSRQKWLSRS